MCVCVCSCSLELCRPGEVLVDRHAGECYSLLLLWWRGLGLPCPGAFASALGDYAVPTRHLGSPQKSLLDFLPNVWLLQEVGPGQ